MTWVRKKGGEARVLGFICSSHRLDDLEKPGARHVTVMCVGSLSPGVVLLAFERGARGVFALGCPEGRCRYRGGHEGGERCAGTVEKLLRLLGIEPSRFRFGRVRTEEARHFVDEFVQGLPD